MNDSGRDRLGGCALGFLEKGCWIRQFPGQALATEHSPGRVPKRDDGELRVAVLGMEIGTQCRVVIAGAGKHLMPVIAGIALLGE